MRVCRPVARKSPALSASSSSNRVQTLRRLAETLVYAVVGGLVPGLSGLPAGYLSGSILAVAAAALAGRPMLVPASLTRAVFVVIGISLGAVVTPAMLHGMAAYPLSLAVLLLAMACVGGCGAAYLRVVHGWHNTDAYLAASPGAMSQVLVLAAELGADLRAIAIVQSLRVVIIAVGLPAGLTLFGFGGHAARPPVGPLTFAVMDELGILVAASAAGAILAHRLRVPGGLMFGAMLTSGVLHGTGLIHAIFPPWVANAAGLVLGAMIGARFANMPLRMFANFLGAAFGSFAVAVAIAAVFGAVLVAALSLNVAEVMIAFAPGSVDAMMLLALALNLDPVYVGAHHVVRIIFVSLSLPLIARRAARKAQN